MLMHTKCQNKLGHMTTSMVIMHDIYLCKQFYRRIIDKKNPVINESNSFNLRLLSNNSITQPKLYIPSTINIALMQWHTKLNVCAVK